MNTGELKTKDDTELTYELKRARRELFDLRMKATIGSDASPAAIRKLRRSIARMMTILRERQLGVRGQSPRSS
ncbi:MAG: 50S ribosomal protein L29 [Planctomycetes bacterium]|nr:50S ribosomal protein L29 [Planctomycetota bacterium]